MRADADGGVEGAYCTNIFQPTKNTKKDVVIHFLELYITIQLYGPNHLPKPIMHTESKILIPEDVLFSAKSKTHQKLRSTSSGLSWCFGILSGLSSHCSEFEACLAKILLQIVLIYAQNLACWPVQCEGVRYLDQSSNALHRAPPDRLSTRSLQQIQSE